MTTTTKQRGGARPGAGAPEKANKKIWFAVSILTDKAKEYGGVEAIKKYAQKKLDEL